MNIVTGLYIYYVVFSTLLGIILGSFLNVVIYRLPVGRTISKGRSMCMSCGHTLAAKDLIPLFSWLFLKGKCRYCGAPVASRYAKIESLTGLVFLISALTNIGAIIFVISPEPLLIIYALYVLLFMITMCMIISAMMIWYDTSKGLPPTAIVSIILSFAAYIMLYIYISESLVTSLLIGAARYVGILIAFVGATALLSKILKREYSKNDLFLDLTFAGAFSFELILSPAPKSFYVFLPAIIYAVIRSSLRGSKKDKYSGIICFGCICVYKYHQIIIYLFIFGG